MRGTVRPFGGTRAEALGVLAVERATFCESPYTADELRIMLTQGPQRAWLAMCDREVVGFVVAFPTNTLSGICWEIDLLAVHPAWRGFGLATRLVRAAASYGSRITHRARAVVATDNDPSASTFAGVGFTASEERHDLLIIRPRDGRARSGIGSIRLPNRLGPGDLAASEVLVWELASPKGSDAILLQADRDGRAVGLAELVKVLTLLYQGYWIESLTAESQSVSEALIRHTLQRALNEGLDEVGAMVPRHDRQLKQVLLASGFFSLGEYVWFTASLPLPDRSPSLPEKEVGGHKDAPVLRSSRRVRGSDV